MSFEVRIMSMDIIIFIDQLPLKIHTNKPPPTRLSNLLFC